MTEQLTALVAAGDTAALAGMIARGAFSALPEEDKGALPRLAAACGQAAVLRLLCTRCHAVTLTADEDGRDVLHHACRSGDGATVAFAVEVLGLDPLRGDRRGVTPYDLARRAEDQAAYRYLAAHLGFLPEEGYRNPVRRGFYPDPSVVRVGQDYYMVNSTFTWTPGLPISHSRDLVHWRTVGHVVTDAATFRLEGLPGGYGYWAPDISYHGGRFWVVATLRRQDAPLRLQMITSALRPEGPWDAPRFLPVDGIDPSLFTDVDGRRYLVVNPGAQIAEISPEGELLEEPQLLYAGSIRVKSEGPHLLYRDGWYYLFQAEGGTGRNHTETVARARTLRGPYAPCPFNPILGRKEEDGPIQRSGHGKPVMDASGRWQMVYLCTRNVRGQTLMGRETGLDPIEWTAEGWPMVNRLRGPSCLGKMPGAAHPVGEEIDWITPRGQGLGFAAWQGEQVTLQAGAELDSLGPVSLLARRQTEALLRQEAEVDASALAVGGKAGLAGYYDERSWYLFGLERQAEGFRLAAWEQVGDTRREAASLPWAGAAIRLRVMGRAMTRALQYLDGDAWRTLTTLVADYLTDGGLKGGKRYTGATVGLATTGSGSATFTGRAETMTEDDADE